MPGLRLFHGRGRNLESLIDTSVMVYYSGSKDLRSLHMEGDGTYGELPQAGDPDRLLGLLGRPVHLDGRCAQVVSTEERRGLERTPRGITTGAMRDV